MKSLITAILCALIANFCSAATKYTASSGGRMWTYTLNKAGDATVVSVDDASGALSVPSSLDGHGVIEIDANTFKGDTTIESVSVSSSIKTIGHNAFGGCTGLKTISLNEGLETIEYEAFYNCPLLKTVTIPDSVTSLGNRVFKYCSGLTNAVLGIGLTTLPQNTFDNCTLLEDVQLGRNMQTIGQSPFTGCNRIKSITLPSTVTLLGDYAFYELEGLETVTLNEGLKTISHNAFGGCTALKEIRIPSTVTTIEYEAFYNCPLLKTVTVPDSVTSLGNRVFKYCSGLTNAVLGIGLTTLPQNTFDNCTLLENVQLGRNMQTIGQSPFTGCNRIKSITLPSTVTLLGDYAFYELEGLETVTLNEGLKTISHNAFGGCTALKEIRIPSTVTTIEYEAFYNCPLLKTVTVPDSVTSLGNTVFSKCSGLTNAVLGVGLTKLPQNTFDYCTMLEDVQIGRNIQTIGSSPFTDCNRIKSITLPSTVTEIGDYAFASLEGLESLTLNEGLKTISHNAFGGCTALKEIRIPSTVTTIEYEAFYNCPLLKTVTVPDSVIEMGNYVFQNCTGLYYAEIGNGIAELPYGTFYGCSSLRGVKLGTNIDTIGSSAFYNCTLLRFVQFEANACGNVDNYAFKNVKNSMVVYIEPTATGFGDTWQGYVVKDVSEMPENPYAPYDFAFFKLDEYPLDVFLTTHPDNGATPVAETRFVEGNPLFLWFGFKDLIQEQAIVDDVWFYCCDVNSEDNREYFPYEEEIEIGGSVYAHGASVCCATNVGPHKLLVQIDPWKDFEETDTLNNFASIDYTVVPGIRVDFVDDEQEYGSWYYEPGVKFGYFPTTPTRLGYKFLGWFTALEGGTLVSLSSLAPSEPMTLYAHWVIQPNEIIAAGGTLMSGKTIWTSGNLYKVTSSLTIPSGAELVIEPGVTVKFAKGTSMTVTYGGKLTAEGTRTLPIVFTSMKDDDHGGDTDESEAIPAYDDWEYIVVSGEAKFAHASFLYGGGEANSTETGMLIVNRLGDLSLKCCTLAHALYDGIFSRGTVEAENTIVYDCDRGVNTSGKTGVFHNCVFHDCRWSVMSEGGAGEYYNCIMTGFYGSETWPTGWGAALWSGSLKLDHCCVWSDREGAENYRRSPKVVECLNVDPLFLDPDSGNFRLDPNSPCVDAGNGAYAPEEDFYGSPRMDVETIRDKGTASANGSVPDIGIYEVSGNADIPAADLAVTSVTAPETLTIGTECEISWTVVNSGEKAAIGSWRDELEIVTANGQTVSLGAYTVADAQISIGASKTFKRKFSIPCAAEGVCRVRVAANKYHDLFEGVAYDNNTGSSDEATVVATTLSLAPQGDPVSLTLSAGAETGYVLDYGGVDSAVVVIRGAGELAAWAGTGSMTLRDNAVRSAVQIAEDAWALQIPAGGESRLSLANDGEETTTASLAIEVGDFFLLDLGAVSAANSGMASVPFAGNGLEGDLTVWLEKDGRKIMASSVAVSQGVSGTAVFNVEGAAEGTWSLSVQNGADVESVAALVLKKPTVGALWYCSVDIANTIRSGRVYLGAFSYENKGDTSLAAPYVRIEAKNGTLVRFSEADAWTTKLELMAASDTLPASVLKAGDTGRITFFYKTSSATAEIEYAYTLASEEAFPWDEARTTLKPSSVTEAAWSHALKTLQANLGATWNDYLVRMRSDSDHLMEIGSPVKRLDRIWQLEIADALGTDAAQPTLASATDLARSARGLGLSFVRTYASSMSKRFNRGILGYGWMDNYSTYAELLDPETLVFHLPSGGSYSFTKASGSWQPEDARDKSILTETDAAYVLTYASGTVQTFSKSNLRTAAITDNQGNILSFTYATVGSAPSADRVTRVSHSDGQYLAFNYSGEKLVSATDDQGRTTTYGYDGDLLTSVTAYNGLVTRYAYQTATGTPKDYALTKITYADGTTKEFAYDEKGLLATVSMNGGQQKTEIRRGDLGSYTIVAPNGGETVVTVAANGETLKTVNALGETVKQVYTEDSLLEATVAPSGKRNKVTYDKQGSPIASMAASGATTSFAYTSEFDNLASVTDAKGHAFTYGYDDKGRSTSVGYADGSASTLAYNEKGDVVKSTNRRGESVTYAYDNEGNLIRKTWDNGRTFTLTYDEKGNVTQAADSRTGAVTMEYDANERLTKIVYPKNRGFTFKYDAAGRTVERATLDGTKECYEYDAFGRLARVTDGTKAYLTNAYDSMTGWLVTQTYGNGTVVSNAYDLLGRTTGIYHLKNGNRLAFFEYAYDIDGKCVSQTTAEGVERYSYDADGQLTAVIYPDGTSESFAYDAVGNRTTANGATYTVNELNQYVAISDGTTLAYDRDGNLISRTVDGSTTTYAYDTLNRLIAVTNTAKNIRWSCEYDVFGNRVSVTDNGATTEKVYVQGSLASVAAEYVNGALAKRHIVVGAVRLADQEDGATRYYHTDLLGSTRLTTDAAGTQQGSASYKAFGAIRKSTGKQTDAGYVGTLGIETDANGLLFMRNRYYDAGMGRFIQMDPIGVDSSDINLYRYCHNGCVLVSDIVGLDERVDRFEKLRKKCRRGNVEKRREKFSKLILKEYGTTVTYSDQKLREQGKNVQGYAYGFSDVYLPDDFDPKNLDDASTAYHEIVGHIEYWKDNLDFSEYPIHGCDWHIRSEFEAYTAENTYREQVGLEAWDINERLLPYRKKYCGIDGGGQLSGETVTSWDPNEMKGPAGVGEKRIVMPGDWMSYTIYFENKTNATAAAQEVFVDLAMDENLDWSTLELGEIAFGDHIDLGLSGKSHGTTSYANPGTNTFVRTTVSQKDGVLSWYLRDWDPTTWNNFPDDPEGGFLPPNRTDTHCGEGHLSYRVRVKSDAPAKSVITASAKIVFDSNPMIETDPVWWNTVGPDSFETSFSDAELTTNEGDVLTLTVSGGNTEKASSAAVYLTYLTAAAADIDLKTAKVDGVTPKGGIKFPLTLNWAAGEVSNRVIRIPVKTDKTIEADETLVFQLAAAQGQELGEVTTCAVTIRDANVAADYAAKQTKEAVKVKKGVETNALAVACVAGDGSGTVCGYTTGQGKYSKGSKASLKATARPGWEFKGWGEVADGVTNIVSEKASWNVTLTNDAEIVALFGRIPYVAGLASPADGGKVAGSGYCAAGKKVTLKATANKNFTFAGWVADAVGDGTPTLPIMTPTLVFDRSAKPAKSDAKQTVITNVSESVTYYATFKSDPTVYVYLAADDNAAAPGKVTGAGKYAAGKKKIALKATANKGYVFRGWYEGASVDLINDVPLTKSATYTLAEMPTNDVEYTAGFITANLDKSYISATVNGMAFETTVGGGTPTLPTNIWTGVYLEWPVAASALSETTVKVAGLPSGLKFTAKDVTQKIGSGKTAQTVVVVPANTIYGAPSAASKTATDKKTGAVTVTPSAVKITVTTAGKSSQTYQINTTVDPLPSWVVGTFAGPSYDGGRGATALPDDEVATNGLATVTIGANGKISAKQPVNGKSTSFAASYFDSYAETDDFGPAFFATLTAKVGKEVVTNKMVVCGMEMTVGDGTPTLPDVVVTNGYIEADLFDAWQYNWKSEPWKTLIKPHDKKTTAYVIKSDGSFSESEEDLSLPLGADIAGRVTLKFAASGSVTASGEFVSGYDTKKAKYTTVKATGSATLVPGGDGHGLVFVYLSPKGLSVHTRCVTIPLSAE